MSDSSGSAEPPASLQQQIDAICDRFAAALKTGSSPKIEDFLEPLAGDNSHELLQSLIVLELQHRQEQGDDVTPADYQQRYGTAIVDVGSSRFKEYQLTKIPSPSEAAGNTRYEPSRRIGPFKLLQSLGHGGMGEVWMADQLEPVKRRVALKLVKSGMDSKQMLARFEAERQALAMMNHPHIAKVLDAGITADGTPYFAMELVLGKPITDYCDRAKLGINERLELFVQVCRAIQHAHQKGILHRDIKPNNVLVTQRDGVPHAKVIDFGLAKALQDQMPLTDKTLFTQAGQAVGTLEYMSPEQAEASELGLDTRTDVYSLGVLLYELLTGSTPIGRERVKAEAFHRVLEFVLNEDAPRPSRRLSESGDAVTGISEQRKIDPKKLTSLLQGELDWIALKALEKNRDRRYDSAGSLADDVKHFLDGDVVEARPPSAGYRLRKTVRKHRTAFATGTAFVLLLIAALVFNVGVAKYALSEAERATAAEEQSRKEARLAKTAQLEAEQALQKQLAAEEQMQQEMDLTAASLFELLAISSNPERFAEIYGTIQSGHIAGLMRSAEQELAESPGSDVSPAEADALSRRQANAAILLLKLGQPESVWPLLKHSPDPGVRSHIIHVLGLMGGDAQAIVNRYDQETDVSIQRALLLCLGQFDLSDTDREPLVEKLLDVYENHADAGLHAAAGWLLRQWDQVARVAEIDVRLQQTESHLLSENENPRDWYVNGQGQTYVILDAGEFQMGSPETEVGRSATETLHRRLLNRRFAIGAQEVTEGQWDAFVSDTATVNEGEYWRLNLSIPFVLKAGLKSASVPEEVIAQMSAPLLYFRETEEGLLAYIIPPGMEDFSLEERERMVLGENAVDVVSEFVVSDAGEFSFTYATQAQRAIVDVKARFSGRFDTGSGVVEYDINGLIGTLDFTAKPEAKAERAKAERAIVDVSWYQAAEYCNWLSAQEGIAEDEWCYEANADGKYAAGMKVKSGFLELSGYRLPTEAEWEYACRAGSRTSRYYGNGEDLLSSYAWYNRENSNHRIHVPGELKPNDFGLCDMLGNAWEWCYDGYGTYPVGSDGSAVEDRQGTSGTQAVSDDDRRVLRGGSFDYPSSNVRSANRGDNLPDNRYILSAGLRAARTYHLSP